MKIFSVVFLMILPAAFFADITWTKHTISSSYYGPSSVYAIDINEDSAVDVLSTAFNANVITYWQNNGYVPVVWTEYDVATGFTAAAYAYPIDLDQDDDIDVCGASWYGSEIAWWENIGGSPIQWIKHSVDTTFYHAHEVFAVDLDFDDDIDLLGASALLNEIAWWESDGNYPYTWTKHIVDDNFGGARSVRAVDINNDSLIDILGAALTDHDITLWYNNGDTTWTEQVIDGLFYGAHMVHFCDLNQDGYIDVLGAGFQASDIAWWENDGSDTIQWTKQLIDGNFIGALSVFTADIDQDDNIDVLGAAESGDEVAWWQNDGSNPINWTKQTIGYNMNGAWPVSAADFDGDDDLDVICGASYGNELAWYESNYTGIFEDRSISLSGYEKATIINGPLSIPPHESFLVFDITGRQVDPGKLVSGVYLIVIDNKIKKKVVKIR